MEKTEEELTASQVNDLLSLAPWQGRDPEIMYSDKFKAEYPNYKDIEPPPLYYKSANAKNHPYLGLIDDEHMKHHVLKKKDGKYSWHRNTEFD